MTRVKRFLRAIFVAAIISGVLLTARPARADWWTWCETMIDWSYANGADFYVTGSLGVVPPWNLNMWQYEVHWQGEVFYGTCVE